MISKLKKLFDKNESEIRKARKLVEKINSLEEQVRRMSFEEMKNYILEHKGKLQNFEELEEHVEKVFAFVREVARRTVGMRHFDVQLIGGIVLHKGKIAEMKTGEGKTLVATAPVVLNSLMNRNIHMVTVNDYLAKRDAMWMGPIYLALGLRVGIINTAGKAYEVVWKNPELAQKGLEENYCVWPDDFDGEFLSDELKVKKAVEAFEVDIVEVSKKEAYRCDVTYGTNSEFGFDYLRDNLVISLEDKVQTGHFYAIVDEVDSILIDEARTPLIISGPSKNNASVYKQFYQIAKRLERDKHFKLDEEHRTVLLTDEGIEFLEKLLGVDNLYDPANVNSIYHITNSLKAIHLFKKDVDYLVHNGQVLIVDEFTGRVLPGRRYSGGLHQAIEAKEGVPIKEESITYATITYQNYFRMYEKLAGMTGTAKTEEEEFKSIYGLEVVVIPTHKPMIRNDRDDLIYRSVDEKYKAIVEEIKKRYEKGQPVLIGTTSIEKSERLSEMLRREKIPHQVLNAKYHEKEAQIIAQAGQKGTVTIATNMAGRGTDIKLGPGVKELGGLCVIGTERHESRRIDNQLRGRSGRQGDPGESIFFLSVEDDLMRIFGGDRIQKVMDMVKIEPGQPIYHPLLTKLIEQVQKKVEGINFGVRKFLLELDSVLDTQRRAIYGYRDYILEHNVDNFINEAIENFVQSRIDEFCSSIEWDLEGLKNSFAVIKDYVKINEKIDDVEKLKADLTAQIRGWYEEKKKEFGEDFEHVAKFIVLRIIDENWRQYLEEVEHVKESVRLRSYGQKDPVLEFKKETYAMFTDMMSRNYELAVSYLLNLRRVDNKAEEESKKELARVSTIHDEFKLVEDKTADGKKKPKLKIKRD
ncbi:MAG: preprotein translocase subunit SecA [Fervidobacterium sp.]|uniref:Protein translocase subunit SecA n=1 Tax=Fervidobacterium gondwanense DSM 13020 TaxID=1121883 RepID=A0A1M7SQP2_FERGO|nr:preprotein translocase subunit SecA [Fervidobacterium gondwanense]SHN60744.1 protein translocase subunit secA [Fervidobacterium gondwanense DSM 13020]